VQSGRELGAWQVSVLPDEPPTVAFLRKPAPSQRKALRMEVEASDDYGVAKVLARVSRSGAVAEDSALAKLPPIELDLPVAGTNQKSVRSVSFHDLTPHPWAGLPVNIQLTARDAAGQTGKSKVIQTTLPERVFTHPVARAIIAQRQLLAIYPDRNRNRVSATLEVIASEREKYDGDVVVFLGLTAASRRLERGGVETPERLAEILKLLWDVALRVEDGTLSLSERALREAQQALRDALSRDATDEELDRLLDQLQQALDEYFKALAEMLRNQPQQPTEMTPIDPRALMLSRDDLRKMLDQIRELSRSGRRDAARRLLSQLQNMLENLRMRQFAQPNARQQRAMKMLNELQGLIREQQELLDKTFREAQRRGQMRGRDPSFRFPRRLLPPGLKPPSDQSKPRPAPMTGESETQEALRRRLGELMRQLGDMSGRIPAPFGRAERSMRQSTGKLQGGQAGEAVPPQTRAIDQLQQGARAATERLMRQLGRRGEGMSRPDPLGQRRDPFGRSTENAGRGMNTEDVEIPDRDTLRAARQILEELRRRAGERDRPKPELDYIDRLLKQF
jgi:uncharacterized protein (TIGR02302 family)